MMIGSCLLCLRKTGQHLKLCRNTNYAYNKEDLILNNSIPFDFIETDYLCGFIAYVQNAKQCSCLFYTKCGDAHFKPSCYNTHHAESILEDKFTFYISTSIK